MPVSSFMPEICSRKATMTGSGASGAMPWVSSAPTCQASRRREITICIASRERRLPGGAQRFALVEIPFALPTNGPKGIDELKEQAYYLDYQGVRFISLDVNVYANEAFLKAQGVASAMPN